MALNITINKTAVAASYPAGSTVATAVVSGGTTPYTYSLATGGDYFNIDSSTGVVTTKALMDASSIQSFSVTATDSNSTPESITSGVVYPNIQAAIQNKFSNSNMIYKITKDIDLGNGILTIPDNCTLDFQGGSISNGTIVGSFNVIADETANIFNNIIATSILNEIIHIEWFGGKSYSFWEDVQEGEDSTTAFKLAIQCKNAKTITFNNGYYKITETISIPSYMSVEGNATNSKYYNIRRKTTPAIPLSSKIYFNSDTDNVLFEINNNYTSIKNISLHGTKNADAIHLIDRGYTVKLENVQIYVWNYGIYRTWDKTSRTGFSASKITNCAFAELNGGIFIDYDESDAGSELYFITSNEIENTVFTIIKSFAIYYKSNYSISNNVFRMSTFSKIGYGNYELDQYNTFGCYAIKIESFQTSTVNGGNKIDSCYFEDIIPYRTGTAIEGETTLSNGNIIPTDDSNYATCIFYNCSIELDTTYYTNILRFFKIDNNTSIGINNARFYSFSSIFNNSVWKYTRLIYHIHSTLTPNYLNQVIAYNNNWRISITSPLNGLVSWAVYNDRFNATVINQLEDKFADCPPYIIENSSNILSTRQVSGNFVKLHCICTTSELESTLIEGYIVYQEKYCRFVIVVDNVNSKVKCYVVEDSSVQGHGLNLKYKKEGDTSFSIYINKTGAKFTFIPIRTSIVSKFELSSISDSDIPSDTIIGMIIPKVAGYSNLPSLDAGFKGTSVYDPNKRNPLYWDGEKWCRYDGTNITFNKVGNSNQRPVITSSDDIGFQYYDTTLNKYICWNGTAWVNLDGTSLA